MLHSVTIQLEQTEIKIMKQLINLRRLQEEELNRWDQKSHHDQLSEGRTVTTVQLFKGES